MGLDFTTGIDLIEKAIAEKRKEKLWDLYVAKYQFMGPDSFISFEEFCDGPNGANTSNLSEDNRTADEIVNEAENILLLLRKEGIDGII